MRVMLFFLLFCLNAATAAALPTVQSGTLQRLENFTSAFVPSRHIDIWLPPQFNVDQAYPVIYMHDGQMLFDANTTWNSQEWQVDEVAGKLIQQQTVSPFIVVAIWNGGENRHSEYFPQKPFSAMPEPLQQQLYQSKRGESQLLFTKQVYSDAYLKFIVTELMPVIETKYRVKADSSYLMGSSMGGLISWYGLLEYPDKFAGAACLSTHWPGDFTAENNPIPAYFQQYIKQNINKLTKQKLYFDYGTATLDAWYPPLQAEIDNLLTHSYPMQFWTSKLFTGADHSESAWAARLDQPLRFLLAEKQ